MKNKLIFSFFAALGLLYGTKVWAGCEGIAVLGEKWHSPLAQYHFPLSRGIESNGVYRVREDQDAGKTRIAFFYGSLVNRNLQALVLSADGPRHYPGVYPTMNDPLYQISEHAHYEAGERTDEWALPTQLRAAGFLRNSASAETETIVFERALGSSRVQVILDENGESVLAVNQYSE